MPLQDLGLLFFSVLMLSLLFTPVSIRIAHQIGAIDRPVGRSVHATAMPRMGGMGMAAALLIGLPLFLPLNPILAGFLTGLLLITLTGVADDVWRIHPLAKMAGQFAACLIFIESSGIYLHSFGNPFGLGEIAFSGAVAKAVTLFCLLGVINAFNMSDGLDGLAAGMVAIACFFFAALALDSHINIAFILAATVFAATLGFLKYNSHPARLFMGDTGSLLLGYVVGCLTVMLGEGGSAPTIAPITVATVIGLPLVDTLWVMARRMTQGKSPLFPDNLHLHHRLLALGFSHAAVVSIIYVWMMLLGTFALVVKDLPDPVQLAMGMLLMGGLYALLAICEQKGMKASFFAANIQTRPERLRFGMSAVLSRSMELLLYIIPVALGIPILVAAALPASVNRLAFALAAFAACVYLLKRNSIDKVNIIYGIFYICAFAILYIWQISSYALLDINIYATVFGVVLFLWAAVKIKLGQRSEVLMTSSFEILLIFLPYVLMPALMLSGDILDAAKFACLAAIPLFIAIKLVTRRGLDRDIMAAGLIGALLLVGVRSF